VSENRGLRRMFEPKRNEVTGNGEDYIVRNLMICTPHPIYSGDQIEKYDSTYEGELRCIEGFGGES